MKTFLLFVLSQMFFLTTIQAQSTIWEVFQPGLERRVFKNDTCSEGSYSRTDSTCNYCYEGYLIKEKYNGLSENSGYVHQDKNTGIYWINSNGLTKFDGQNYSIYHKMNSNIPTTELIKIVTDKKGNVWMSSNIGLIKFDGQNFTLYDETNSQLPGNYVGALAVDSNDNIWVGATSNNIVMPNSYYYQGGVAKISDSTWTVYLFENSYDNFGLPSNQISDIIFNENELPIVATPGGIAIFNGSQWCKSSDFEFYGVNTILLDANNNLWVGSYGDGMMSSGLHVLDYNNETCPPSPYDTYNNIFDPYDANLSYLVEGSISSIVKDSIGNIWIGLNSSMNFDENEMGRLVKYDGVSFTKYTASNSGMINSDVESLTIDKNGLLWISTFYGICTFDGSNWSKPKAPLPSSDLENITSDNNNNIWSHTDEEVIKYDRNNFHVFNSTNTILPENGINTLFIKNDTVWVGTNKGLFRYDGVNWISLNDSTSNLTNINVIEIGADNTSNIYITYYESSHTGYSPPFNLAKYNGTTWDTIANSINDKLYSIFEAKLKGDNFGNIWIGTSNDGFFKYNGSTWTTYITTNSTIPSNNTKFFGFDKDENLWFVGGFCFNKYDGIDWIKYEPDNSYDVGSSSGQALGIDMNSNIWTSGYYDGLTKFDGVSWDILEQKNTFFTTDMINEITFDNLNNAWISCHDHMYDNGSLILYKHENDTDWLVNKPIIEKVKEIILIYPNPANDYITIENNNKDFNQIKIYDIKGSLLINQKLNNENKVYVKSLSEGVYFIKVGNDNGESSSFKMMKK